MGIVWLVMTCSFMLGVFVGYLKMRRPDVSIIEPTIVFYFAILMIFLVWFVGCGQK